MYNDERTKRTTEVSEREENRRRREAYCMRSGRSPNPRPETIVYSGKRTAIRTRHGRLEIVELD